MTEQRTTPEGHDREYHLKKADGSPEPCFWLDIAFLARPDTTLYEACVHAVLVDAASEEHTSCHSNNLMQYIADTLKISINSVKQAMARLEAKGLIEA